MYIRFVRNIISIVLFCCLCFLVFSCGPGSNHPKAQATEIHNWNKALDEAIIHDGFSPPVAARIYAYTNLAYYHLLLDSAERQSDLPNKLFDLPDAPKATDLAERALQAGIAFYMVGKHLVYTNDALNNHYEDWKKELLDTGWSKAEIAYAEIVTKKFTDSLMTWVNTDGYPLTRSMPRYTLHKDEGDWRPTPQDYMEALEPYWGTIRPFLLDSNTQFRPAGPQPYSLKPNSAFMLQFDSLLKATRQLSAEQIAIARHWDDNSVSPIHAGHSTSIEKKLTPGGHWMSIARSLAINNQLSLIQSAAMYCQMAMAMEDGFIACWEAKYFFHSIRPVTVILEHIDPTWKPLLVNPSFPEYPSGHSAISSAAATVLENIFGTDKAFTDSSEVPFGYPPRQFNSLRHAAQEVSDSRFYGGIHFIKALDDAMLMGRSIGQYHIKAWKKQ